MKTQLNLSRTLANLLIITIIIVAYSGLVAQTTTETDLKDFEIIIEKTTDGLKLECKKGSAWINLSFSLSDKKEMAIDEYGMSDLNRVSANKNSKLADYLITIMKTDEGIKLKGVEGTAWTKLSFTLKNGERQAINQFGMIAL
ncbi:MAG: hypothetical protein C0595_00430 [Marinilabiliales bacterium]|nr:MAG: hypothetical protein C0595_00430 [Marinilabiliales bacterium]